MKLRTRIVAWIHILAEIPGILTIILLTLFGGGFLIRIFPHLSILERSVGGSLFLGAALVITSVVFLNIFPWIALLKKKQWAWWLLTILYGTGTAIAVLSWIPFPKPGKELTNALHDALGPSLYFCIIFLILITDRPKTRKRSTTRRRRKTPARSYARRRRYTYD